MEPTDTVSVFLNNRMGWDTGYSDVGGHSNRLEENRRHKVNTELNLCSYEQQQKKKKIFPKSELAMLFVEKMSIVQRL